MTLQQSVRPVIGRRLLVSGFVKRGGRVSRWLGGVLVHRGRGRAVSGRYGRLVGRFVGRFVARFVGRSVSGGGRGRLVGCGGGGHRTTTVNRTGVLRSAMISRSRYRGGRLALFGHDRVEAVLLVGRVVHHAPGAVRFDDRVLSLDVVAVPLFGLRLVVARVRVGHVVRKVVLGRGVGGLVVSGRAPVVTAVTVIRRRSITVRRHGAARRRPLQQNSGDDHCDQWPQLLKMHIIMWFRFQKKLIIL